MDILSIAKAHFNVRRNMVVPEWRDDQGAPVVLWWKPISSLEMGKIQNMSKAKGETGAEYNVRLLVAKVENEAGESLFRLEDIPALQASVDGMVISRIASAIVGLQNPEDVEKN
jgi:hypothetical protein